MSCVHKHFGSTTEYRMWLLAQTTPHNLGWDDRQATDLGIDLLQKGDDSHVAEARKLLAEFQEKIEVPHLVWQHAVAGFFPDVPAYLAGEPENMYIRQAAVSERTPIRVWVGVMSSGGISDGELVQRGVTIAAFALALIEHRPVIISPYVVNSDGYGHDAVISWDISTEPLVVGELLASLARPEISRYVGHYGLFTIESRCRYRWPEFTWDEDKMKQHLGAGPEDVNLPSIHLCDPLLNNPLEWLKTSVAKYTTEA